MDAPALEKRTVNNIPNILTLSRILSVPVFLVLMLDPAPARVLSAAAVFTLASVTDWLDGYLARKWGQVTKIGKLLDPIADKILVTSALVILVRMDVIAAWIAVVIIGREFAVTGLRSIAATDGIVIPAEKAGKYKVVMQIIAVVSLLLDHHLAFGWLSRVGTATLWVAMVLGIYSGAQYFAQYWKRLS